MEKKQVPAIRFQGFTDAWEQRKFSDLVLIERGGSPRPIDAFITDDPNGLNWVKIGDAPEQGRYITNTAEKIRPEGLSKTREVHPGDLILSNSMSFGKPYIMGIDGCIHDGWLLIRDTQKRFDLKFLCHMLGTDQMLNQYRAFAAGSTVNNLNKELVGNTTVTIPSLEEQQVLGQYFENLDHLITLHQRKYEKLLKVKKSMLEKMFPRDGADVPEIRFDGFTDAWEQRKLGEVIRLNGRIGFRGYTEKDIVSKDDGGVLTFSPTNIVDNKLTTNCKNTYITRFKYDESPEIKIHNGDILFVKTGSTLGKSALVTGLSEDATLNPQVVVMRTNNLNAEFLAAMLVTNIIISQVNSAKIGGAVPTLTETKIKDFDVVIPISEAEEEQIGQFFSQLDHLITLHQRKLEKLRNIKKSLLEKMFV